MEINNLQKIIDQRIKKLNSIPNQLKTAYLKTLKAASSSVYVKAQCYECMGYEDLSNAIKDCKGFTCPLYFVRPRQYSDTRIIKDQVLDYFIKQGYICAKKSSNLKDNEK